MDPEDRIKTVDLLEKNADNDVKKKKFKIVQKTMGRFINTVRLVKNIINKQKIDEEEEKQNMHNINNNNSSGLQNKSLTNNSNNNNTLDSSNINKSNSNSKGYFEEIGKKDLNLKSNKSMEMNRALLFLDKVNNPLSYG